MTYVALRATHAVNWRASGGVRPRLTALLVVNKPTGQWEMPKKKTVWQLFTIGAKATEDDFDRKARYITYIFWGASVLLFVGFFVIY